VVGRSRLFRELLSAHLATIGLRAAAEAEDLERVKSVAGLRARHLVLWAVSSEAELSDVNALMAQCQNDAAPVVVILPAGQGLPLPRKWSQFAWAVPAEDGLSGLTRALDVALQALERPNARDAHSDQPGTAPVLTRQQQRVLEMVARGWTSRRIAHELGLSRRTVDAHRAGIMRRLGASSAANLVYEAIRRGLVR
jgi:DNA-binding CsgD family transcriptional regulator